MWPEDEVALAAFQHELADAAPEPWTPSGHQLRAGARPVAVHAGWAVDLATAVEVVAGTSARRTPEPLRRARQLARRARAGRIVP